MSSTSDRNLLFGILALQLNFITREQLIEGMSVWVLDKAQSLGGIFVSRKFMEADQRTLLEALVDKHVEKHGGSVADSMHQLSSLMRWLQSDCARLTTRSCRPHFNMFLHFPLIRTRRCRYQHRLIGRIVAFVSLGLTSEAAWAKFLLQKIPNCRGKWR